MKIEVRNDSVVVSGYVNAVERWSKPLKANLRGMMLRFIEKIKAGVFKNALKRNDNVKVLLNHNPDRELANTKDGTALLEEDNIGLRAEVTITDPEVVEKARNNKLVGWSFGFYSNSDDVDESGSVATRTVNDMDLVEVSILDDTKSPAYYGTSIETRSEDGRLMEIREQTLADIENEAKEKHKQVYSAEKAKFEDEENEHAQIDAEANEKKMELFATLVATKVAEMLKAEKRAEETTETAEETPEENTETEATEETKEAEATEERSIDYSAYEERLAKIKIKPEQ
jgi:HK97 family phage prohead protease